MRGEGERLHACLRVPGLLEGILAMIPEAWLVREPPERRRALIALLDARIAAWDAWMTDAVGA